MGPSFKILLITILLVGCKPKPSNPVAQLANTPHSGQVDFANLQRGDILFWHNVSDVVTNWQIAGEALRFGCANKESCTANHVGLITGTTDNAVQIVHVKVRGKGDVVVPGLFNPNQANKKMVTAFRPPPEDVPKMMEIAQHPELYKNSQYSFFKAVFNPMVSHNVDKIPEETLHAAKKINQGDYSFAKKMMAQVTCVSYVGCVLALARPEAFSKTDVQRLTVSDLVRHLKDSDRFQVLGRVRGIKTAVKAKLANIRFMDVAQQFFEAMHQPLEDADVIDDLTGDEKSTLNAACR